MKNRSRGEIGFTSRYYEPLMALKRKVAAKNVFKLVYNSDKNTYHMPYLYKNYKNELDPISISNQIVQSVKQYLNDNLFSEEERNLLLSELKPSIESFGDEIINSLTDRINLIDDKRNHTEIISEYEKTIQSLKNIKEILNNELTINNLIPKNPEPTVFMSYSHDSDEHKDWVLQLATRLRSNGVNVILDRWNIQLGGDIASFMERGLSQSSRIVCVCSSAYVKKANEGRGGAGYEKQIMTSELINDQNTNWIIPLIKNNPETRKTPTFLGGRMYISFEDENHYETKYEELLRDLLDEPVLPIPPIGKNPFQTVKEYAQQKFIPSNEKYVSPSISGQVSFNYSNNNGRYFIGQNELMFELHFSKSSDRNIQLTNDPTSVRYIAIAKGKKSINEIEDARIFDGSSRVRRPNTKQIVVIQNNNGFYAAILIKEIKDDTRGAENDEVTFEYKIQSNGSPDFRNEKSLDNTYKQ